MDVLLTLESRLLRQLQGMLENYRTEVYRLREACEAQGHECYLRDLECRQLRDRVVALTGALEDNGVEIPLEESSQYV